MKGKNYPAFNLTNDSLSVNSEKLKGKVVYINFWFAACKPCMSEMPQINDLYERFKSDTNFVLLSITFDKKMRIEEIKQKFGIIYPIFSISHEETGRLNPSHFYPASFILNKEGVIMHYETGGKLSAWITDLHFKKKIYKIIEKELKL